ncbi:uncharacterized protein LOC120898208 isoform X2 [Anopheles arabiensis]|uniref:uncharacterized protein LOC120898208 isoform X2 n=1 Tax=Anopheles arabiensis TaxID=7173 RepID=UPI001AADFFBA|nr:uncharacterized protein LOC120898208 isoform X2 [Anopheles arabiensis]
MYAQSGVVQVDWNERFGSTVDIGTGAGNGDVYRRFQDIDGGSNSSASNDTESTTLLDETVRKHERLYDITPPAPHNGGGFCMKIFLGLCFSALIMCTVFMNIISTGNDRGRVGTIAGWGLNTSRATVDYVLPEENTTLIDPLNVCTTEERSGLVEESGKVFLLIVVCSSARNFEARQAIRETWGRVREFNYDQFARLHERMRGEYLEPKEKLVAQELQEYMWRVSDGDDSAPATTTIAENDGHAKPNSSSHSDGNGGSSSSSLAGKAFNVKLVFLVGQSEADYVQQRQRSAAYPPADSESDTRRPVSQATDGPVVGGEPSADATGPSHSSLFPSGADVDPAFNPPGNEQVDELQLRLVNESEVYGDIIQESFIDSYNNLTLKTIMMLKWVTNNCDGKEAPEQDRRPLGDRKQYLQFKLETRDFTGDLHAKLMVYVRGEEWLKSNSMRADGGVAGSTDKLDKREVIFTVGRTGKAGGVLERFQRTVPKGLGDFVEFNVTDLVLEWFKERDQGTVRTSKYIAVETLNELAALLVVNSPTDSQFVRPFFPVCIRFSSPFTAMLWCGWQTVAVELNGICGRQRLAIWVSSVLVFRALVLDAHACGGDGSF